MRKMTPSFLVALIVSIGAIAALTGNCPTGWVQDDDRCYLFNDNALSYDSARSYCEGLNAGLAFPDTQDEQDFLWGTFKDRVQSSHPHGMWIGCDDLKSEGVWPCVNLPYVNWGPGQPDDCDNMEDCGELAAWKNGKWNDAACDLHLHSVCEARVTRAFCEMSTGASIRATRCLVVEGAPVEMATRMQSMRSCDKICRLDPKCHSFTVSFGFDEVCEFNLEGN